MGVFDSIGDLFTGGSHVPMRRTEVNLPQPPVTDTNYPHNTSMSSALPSNGINIAGYQVTNNMIIYSVVGVVVIYIVLRT